MSVRISPDLEQVAVAVEVGLTVRVDVHRESRLDPYDVVVDNEVVGTVLDQECVTNVLIDGVVPDNGARPSPVDHDPLIRVCVHQVVFHGACEVVVARRRLNADRIGVRPIAGDARPSVGLDSADLVSIDGVVCDRNSRGWVTADTGVVVVHHVTVGDGPILQVDSGRFRLVVHCTCSHQDVVGGGNPIALVVMDMIAGNSRPVLVIGPADIDAFTPISIGHVLRDLGPG